MIGGADVKREGREEEVEPAVESKTNSRPPQILLKLTVIRRCRLGLHILAAELGIPKKAECKFSTRTANAPSRQLIGFPFITRSRDNTLEVSFIHRNHYQEKQISYENKTWS